MSVFVPFVVSQVDGCLFVGCSLVLPSSVVFLITVFLITVKYLMICMTSKLADFFPSGSPFCWVKSLAHHVIPC